MKKIKKTVAIALAAVMVFALGAVAFGATTISSPRSSDTGTITVNGLEDGVTATAYAIATAQYDTAGNFTGYAMVSGTESCTFQIASDGSYDESALTEPALAQLFDAVVGNGSTLSATAGSDGTATITGVPVGSYLIVISGSESVVYGMMIGSVSYVTEDGSWAIGDGEITGIESFETWAKASTPTIEKTEKEGEDDVTSGSVQAGDEVTYDIDIHNIPSYQGDYPEFYVTDMLSGLHMTTDEIDSIKVTVNGTTLTVNTDYVVTHTTDPEGFTIDFVVNGKYTLNDYAGGELIIEYKATVDDMGPEDSYQDHSNEADLTYATTSYVNHNDPSDPNDNTTEGDGSTTHDYTFSAEFKKVGSAEDDKDGLAGATFTLYTDKDCTEQYVSATSGSDGYFTFSGLSDDAIYYMKETEAPEDYVLFDTVYEIDIDANITAEGELSTWTITVTSESGDQLAQVTETKSTGVSIVNTKVNASGLPSMGGRGTLLFTIIGCAIVACAIAGVAVVTRRRRAA